MLSTLSAHNLATISQDEIVLERAKKEREISKIQGAWRESRARRWVKVTVSTLDSPCFRPSELL